MICIGGNVDSTGGNIKIIPWKDSILDTVRDRPGMYVGVKSLSALWFFLHGYQMCRWRLGQNGPQEVPDHFADWVGYRLHLQSGRSGFWHLAILERIRDEEAAFDRFYELRDEFFKRVPIEVATIRSDRREYKIGRSDEDGNIVWGTELLPTSLKIIVYTNDPGFFLSCDAEERFSDNGRFFPQFYAWNQFSPDRFQIQDESIWHRLTVENTRYRKNLAKRRARSQK